MAAAVHVGSTVFESAFEELWNSVKSQPKKHLSKFLLKCQKASQQVSLESASRLVDQAENASSERTSRRFTRKILEPLVETLKAYDHTISMLCSADPMPTAIIWGSLKVIVDCTDRFASLFTIIKTELSALQDRIEDVLEYESLFGGSSKLQRALFDFYKNVLRFWSRVDKECSRSSITSIVRAVTPSAMIKIRNITNDIKTDVDKIRAKVEQIDWRENKEERRENQEERALNLKALQDAETRYLLKRLHEWLEPSAYQSDLDAHQRHIKQIADGTLEWLCDHADIKAWSTATSQNPLLWATAAPGFGKTIACSKIIETIKKNSPEAAICYHFYQGVDPHSGREVLRSFVWQLLSKLLNSTWISLPGKKSDVEKAIQQHGDIIENIVVLIEIMLAEVQTVFFFIDGLDEALAFGDHRLVVDALMSLCDKSGGRVRFWCSSQSTAPIKELMSCAKAVDFTGRNNEDVCDYLHKALHDKYESEDLDEEDQVENTCEVALRLGDKAHGSFMWAYLMKHDIESADSPAALSMIIKNDVPNGLDQYFKRILHRIDRSKRFLASLLLSLICFARRPLRLSELREAVAILQSTDKSCIDRTQRPFPTDIQKILLPLIKIEDGDHQEKVYKAHHSTLKDFLRANPDVFCEEQTDTSTVKISSLLLGEACLHYLRQVKFSTSLTKRDGKWYTREGSMHGSAIKNNPFTIYAAKYWNTHLEQADPDTESSTFAMTAGFVCSSNFWTCLQIQSLFVEGKFSTYVIEGINDSNKFKKPFLPGWYIRKSSNTDFSEFRTFLKEWDYFLDHSDKDRSSYEEIDRCLISVVGPKSFFAGVGQRYSNFPFVFDGDTELEGVQFENCSADGTLLSLINMKCDPSNDRFEVQVSNIDTQRLPIVAPLNGLKIDVAIDAFEWLPYTCTRHLGERLCVCVDKPHLAGTSSCGRIIRVANNFWKRNANDTLVPLKFKKSTFTQFSLEHVECKNNFIVVTSRQRVSVERKAGRTIQVAAKQKSTESSETHQDLMTKFYQSSAATRQQTFRQMRTHGDAINGAQTLRLFEGDTAQATDNITTVENIYVSDSESISEDDEEDSPVVHEFETEQYWSEASTVPEEYSILADDVAATYYATDNSAEERAQSVITTSSSDSQTQEDDQSSAEATRDSDGDSGATSSDESQYDRAVDAYMAYMEEYVGRERALAPPSDDDDDDDDDDKNSKRRREFMTKKPVASLRVYRDDGNTLTPVFKFTWSNARPVYNSPPAIHPQKDLVVWPATDSLLLFADYRDNTWFKKEIRSPKGCRFMTIRCHFSACGRYLHLAAVRCWIGDLVSDQKQEKTKKNASTTKHSKEKGGNRAEQKRDHKHTLVVLTYVLSGRKTSYSPPRLVHRRVVGLPTIKEPFLTFVWTRDYLFATHSDSILRTYRISLFPEPMKIKSSLPTPQQTLGNVKRESASTSETVEMTALTQDEFQVIVPNETIYLPKSARHRSVYFVPGATAATAVAKGAPRRVNQSAVNVRSPQPSLAQTESTSNATVLVGPERLSMVVRRTPHLMKQLKSLGRHGTDGGHNKASDEHVHNVIGAGGYQHMIGVLLDDKEDLGGWRTVDTAETSIAEQGVGTLDDMVELFDPTDDCDDIEPWIFPEF